MGSWESSEMDKSSDESISFMLRTRIPRERRSQPDKAEKTTSS